MRIEIKRPQALLAIYATICLATAGPSHGARGSFDGVYAGTRVRTAGPPQTCPTEEDVSVDISGSTLKLTNSAFQGFSIGFQPDPHGNFNQTDVEGTGSVYIKGRITGDTIDADVINFPRDCQHHWHLTKQPSKQ
jgi:hypothetical protein